MKINRLQIIVLLVIGFLFLGCGYAVKKAVDITLRSAIEKAASGDEILPLGGNQFQIKSLRSTADQDWHRIARQICPNYKIIAINKIMANDFLPEVTGVIECAENESAVIYDPRTKISRFIPDQATEETVRAILDRSGEPIDVWELKNNIPLSRVLIYNRSKVNAMLFIQKGQEFIFQGAWSLTRQEFDKAKDTPAFREEMYSNLLAQRAGAAERKGESDQEFECIKRIMEAKPLNDLAYAAVAWFYASSPEARYRNGKKAVEYAEKAVSLKRHYAHLDTLAAAYAEAGDFAKAVSIQEEAIRLCDSQLKGDFGERLALYQSQRPYYRKPR